MQIARLVLFEVNEKKSCWKSLRYPDLDWSRSDRRTVGSPEACLDSASILLPHSEKYKFCGVLPVEYHPEAVLRCLATVACKCFQSMDPTAEEPAKQTISINKSKGLKPRCRSSSLIPFWSRCLSITVTPKLDSGARCRQSERNLCCEEVNAYRWGEHFSYWIKVRLHFAIAFCKAKWETTRRNYL